MKITLTTIYVTDQAKPLKFYSEVLGFVVKADFTKGTYRWLTVAPAEDPDGVQLQLAADDNPAGKAYQQALFAQNQPAIMFHTNDVDADAAKITANGGTFAMAPTDVTGSRIAQLHDGCGNLVQLTQLKW